MEDVIPIIKDGKTYALFFRKDIRTEDGVRFPTPRDASLQVGVFDRDEGYIVKPHRHPERDLKITQTAEFLYVASGKAEVSIFDDAWNEIAKETVSQGDFVLLLLGGHSLRMLEQTRLVEVKQGPYPGEADAKVFRDTI